MEKTFSEASKDVQMSWQKPGWYRAATLTERIASLRAHGSPRNIPDAEKAQRKLQPWKEQAAFKRGIAFADRLVMDAITEEDLLHLLTEPIEDVQARMSHPTPDWLVELARAFEAYDATDEALPPARAADGKQDISLFLKAINPLLLRGLSGLYAGIQKLSQQYVNLPFDRETIVSLLYTDLTQQMLSRLSRTLVLELNVARLRGRLQGDTPEERFEDFVRQLSSPGEILPLLEEYCVLARQLVMMIDLWLAYSLEFLERLCTDWEDICTVFTRESSDPGVLVEVAGGAGDTHRGGRSVMLLKFSSGFQLVYKPKSLAIDVHFQELLMWLNEHGQQPTLRTLKLIDRGTYGWSEFISACECRTEEEVERFYERQGAYLALLYVLEATDFHYENVLAAGEHPVLIDLEALFHPRVRDDELRLAEDPAFLALVHSVLRIGLLPQRIWATNEAAGIDISGLGGQEGQLTPMPLPRWEAAGSDEMRLVKERVAMPAGKNRPRLNGHDIDTLNYSERITAGFGKMYRLLLEHRDELLTEILPRFTHDEIRFVARPTRTYALLLSGSFHPNVLRNALDRDRHFDRLWIEVDQRPYLSRLIPAERADLLRGDLPMFTTRPDSCALFTYQSEQITDFFQEPSLELVRKRLQQLDEADLSRQTWMIQASFTSMLMGTAQVSKLQLQPSPNIVTRERLLLAARAVGDRLETLALRHEDAVGWLGVVLLNEREWHLTPADMSLYHGMPGIALFLAYLGAITGESRYTALAKAALKTILSALVQQKRQHSFVGIGAFDGLGGTLYLLSHLGVLWNDPALIRQAEELIELLPGMIEKDNMLDIMAGSAGCIMSLLSLNAVAPSARTLEAAVQCGRHLLHCAQRAETGVAWKMISQRRPLTGLSHGAAGIALSLLKLAEVSGEERFRQTSLDALAYERSLFSPCWQNWPDLREGLATATGLESQEQTQHEEEHTFMTAWCHGAPGIGLARLASLEYIDDAVIREEIDIALKTTVAEGFGRNHSLCHGDFGNLETLLMAAQTLDQSHYHEQLQYITAMLLDSLNTQGWVTGVPLGVETPGLMTGLAGTGYELLRLAEPEMVPSVLLLAPPCF